MNGDSENSAKRVAYYAASVSAFIDNRMEKDKALLTLSAGAIGLVVAILSGDGVRHPLATAAYIAAALSFLWCIGVTLVIFRKNSDFLKALAKDDGEGAKKVIPELKSLDEQAGNTFFAGAVLLAAVVVVGGISEIVEAL